VTKPFRRNLASMQRKGGEKVRAKFAGKRVLIYSNEHSAFWRSDYCGYTIHREAAGVYDFADAWKKLADCGADKQIAFEQYVEPVAPPHSERENDLMRMVRRLTLKVERTVGPNLVTTDARALVNFDAIRPVAVEITEAG
jgi:hypothetical protein